MQLDVADRDLGDRLGAGGQAVIHDLPGLRLPDVPGPLVYKKYRDDRAPRTHDMFRLVQLREGLAGADRARLDAIATWPVRLVCDGPDLRGVVLPRIPDSYFQPVTLPGTGASKKLVREVQHLFVDPAIGRRTGMPEVTREQRLTICRDFAAALDFLHGPAMDVVFGDINAKNELFRLGPEPTVMLVDCDAVRPRGAVTGGLQLNAPDWEPPGRTTLNRATDLYKLGLFVLRCVLPPGSQTSTRRDPVPGLLDDAGTALLTRALAPDPHDRPSAGEWLRHLSLALGPPAFVFDPPRWADLPVPMPRLDPLPVVELVRPDLSPVLPRDVPALDFEPPPLTGVTAPATPPATYHPLPTPPITLPGLDPGDPEPVDLTDLFLPRKGI